MKPQIDLPSGTSPADIVVFSSRKRDEVEHEAGSSEVEREAVTLCACGKRAVK